MDVKLRRETSEPALLTLDRYSLPSRFAGSAKSEFWARIASTGDGR